MKLLKTFLVVGCFFLLSHQSSAQARIDLGLKGGLNFSSINASASAVQNYKGRTGYHVGAYVLVKIAKFGIQPEVIFSKQGQTYSFPGNSNLQSNFDYINIPIMLKLYLAAGLNLQAGPQFGFLANSKGDLFNSGTSTVSTGQNLNNFVKSSDVSLGLGVGWDLPFGLNLTARYNLGLSDINKYTGGSIPGQYTSSLGTSQAKNQVFQFSVGYRLFKIGS